MLMSHYCVKRNTKTACVVKFILGFLQTLSNPPITFFQGFNKEIEEIARVQRGYSIPDVELRESIKRDNKELIIPKYHAFYNV